MYKSGGEGTRDRKLKKKKQKPSQLKKIGKAECITEGRKVN